MDPSSDIKIICIGCEKVIPADPTRSSYDCSHCNVRITVERCQWCRWLGEWTASGPSWDFGRKGRCLYCGQQTRIRRNESKRPSVADVASQWAQIGRSPDVWDAQSRGQAGLTVIGGFGHELAKHAQCFLVYNRDEIVVSHREHSGRFVQALSVPYEDTYMEIGGRGAVTTGGGYVGGGFGAQGALEGILIASFLNAATTKVRYETIIGITHPGYQLICLFAGAGVQAVQVYLAPVLARLRAVQLDADQQPRSQGGEDLADQLQRLAQLYESGALSEAEFEAAKRRIINPT